MNTLLDGIESGSFVAQDQKLLEVFWTLETLVVSLDRIGSYKALHPEFNEAQELSNYIDFKRLSRARSLLVELLEERKSDFRDYLDLVESKYSDTEIGYWT
jgi:hypothetical protein